MLTCIHKQGLNTCLSKYNKVENKCNQTTLLWHTYQFVCIAVEGSNFWQ